MADGSTGGVQRGIPRFPHSISFPTISSIASLQTCDQSRDTSTPTFSNINISSEILSMNKSRSFLLISSLLSHLSVFLRSILFSLSGRFVAGCYWIGTLMSGIAIHINGYN
ncbi:hypothetical protein L2E82_08739 [Cichorium intybus]|uniref:Uncharacterized protein n=1 Tax=Cichorium intybus TaxID=13427 RepID=A0ACB9G7X4_CICIN|nr:hypothetical protein L2E82_08739 [Cichorium intybus]